MLDKGGLMTILRIICIVLMLTGGATAVQGAPFLTCDSYPAGKNQPKKFLITIGDKTFVSTPAKNPDGSVYLSHDLADLPDGTYRASVKAVNAQGEESPPVIFGFQKTGSTALPYTPPEPKGLLPPSRSYDGYLK